MPLPITPTPIKPILILYPPFPGGNIKVKFLEEKVRAITPGQGVVFYDEEKKVLGSGFII